MHQLSAWAKRRSGPNLDAWPPGVRFDTHTQTANRAVTHEYPRQPLIPPREIRELLSKVINPQDHAQHIVDMLGRVRLRLILFSRFCGESAHCVFSCYKGGMFPS